MAEVLVVDDDEEIRETLRWVLEDEGHTVHEAADGVGALAILRASAQPLVVLLDLMMPRLNGEGVLRAVDADAALRDQHSVVLVTAKGKSVPAQIAWLLHDLRAPIIPKPFDLDDLLRAVDRAARRLERQPPVTSGEVECLSPIHL
jgi:CheY-like chemotaxis protein